MANLVLKAANVAVDTSYVRKTFATAQDEVWVSVEVAFGPAALALWTTDGTGATTFSGDFIDLIIDGGSGIVTFFYIDGAGPGPEWTGPGALGPPPVPVAGSYQLVEIHFLRNVVREVYVDGTLVATDTVGNTQIGSIHVGQNAEAPLDPDAAAYIGHVKAGTTRGATDLFSDDFSSGDLSAWTGSTGEVSVVSDPFPAALEGVCIAFDDPTLEPSPTWTRLDDPSGYRFVTSWSINRGRQSELDKTGTGTATVEMVDLDGSLDPTNPSSPFAGTLDPMKQAAIALRDPVDDNWHTVFRGFVSDWFYEMDVSGNFSTVRLELADAFDLLAALEMTPGHHGDTPPVSSRGDIYFSQTAGPTPGPFQRINQILDDAGWPADLRFVLTGNVQLQANVYERLDQALSALFDTADAEFPGIGNVYMTRDGRVAFRGRYSRFDPENPDWDIDFWNCGGRAQADADPVNVAPITGLSFRRSKQDVINAVTATPQLTNGEWTEAELATMFVKDDASIAQFGWRGESFENLLVFSARESPDATTFPITAVDETKLYADYYVDNYAQPTTRIEQVVLRSRGVENAWAGALWALLTQIDIGDVLHVNTSHVGGGGFDEDFFVDGLQYEVEPKDESDTGEGFPDVTVTIAVTPRSLYVSSPFLLGADDTGGGSDFSVSIEGTPEEGETLTAV